MSDHFARLDSADFPPFVAGTVWLVGAGPGSAGLLSLLGYYALGQADVIVYDALVSEKLLALANPHAEKIYAGKRGGKPSAKQSDITLELIAHAKQGRKVLRLKGGDPYMFGRGGEEARMLHAEKIGFRIVPGVTAGIGGLAYAGIPATHRDTNQAVIFLTGHDGEGIVPQSVDWSSVATATPVIVMYMAVKHIGAISQRLLDAGRQPDDPIAIVSNASLPQQHVVTSTLGEISALAEREPLPTPSIIVVGPVSKFRDQLDWFQPYLRDHDFG